MSFFEEKIANLKLKLFFSFFLCTGGEKTDFHLKFDHGELKGLNWIAKSSPKKWEYVRTVVVRKYTLQTYNLQPLTYQQLFPMLKIFLKNAIPVVVVLVGKISSLSCLLVTISFLTKKERMRV